MRKAQTTIHIPSVVCFATLCTIQCLSECGVTALKWVARRTIAQFELYLSSYQSTKIFVNVNVNVNVNVKTLF